MKGLVGFAEKNLGLQLWPGQVDVLEGWAESGRRKALLVIGRRSGKTLMSAIAAIKNAVDEYEMPRHNELRSIVCVANRQEQAAEFLRTCRELVEAAPDRRLKALVDWGSSTQDQITFRSGARIMAMPCSSRSTRGLAVSAFVMDEAGWMSTSEDGFAAGRAVYNALAPATSQFREKGFILLTSTPNWRSGVFWDMYQLATEGRVDDIFIAQKPTWEMNPQVTREQLEPEFRADPDAANREYGAEFTAAAGAYLDPKEVLACVRPGQVVLPPMQSTRYAAALDPAYTHDAFAMAVVHREPETGLVVVDGVWSWTRAGHEATLDYVTEIARAYRITTLRTDQNATVPVKEGLGHRGLTTHYVPWDNANKLAAFSKLKVLINTGAIELPSDERLLHELFGLEARPTPSGLTRIAAAGSGHDDLVSAIAGAVARLESTISPAGLERWRELLRELSAAGKSRSAFSDVTGVPGVPNWPLDRL